MHANARKLAFSVAALLLLAGASVLGVLQVGWVNAATREEEARLWASLSMGVSRVRKDAEDEIRVLASLVSIGPADFTERRWDGLDEGVRFWYSSSRYPKLLMGAFIVTDPRASGGYEYSAERGAFVPAELSPELLESARLVLGAADDREERRQARTAERAGYLIVPIRDAPEAGATAGGESAFQVRGAVVIRLSRQVLYGRIVPDLMSRNLDGFPYRVLDTLRSAAIVEWGDIAPGAAPEVTVDLSSTPFFDMRWQFSQPADAAGNPATSRPSSADDPSMRFWLLRLRKDTGPPIPTDPQELGAPEVVMEVFSPHGSIRAVIQARRVAGLGVSAGILTALVLSAFVLYRLYRRSARLRMSEQEFVASVSHELRTPITVIQATSENLRRGLVTDPQRVGRYADVIHGQIRRLSGMVESILLYSGLQSGVRHRSGVSGVDPARLVEDIVSPLRELAIESGKSVRVQAAALPPLVRLDAGVVRLVVENLVMNAIRHTDSGEIRVAVSHPEPATMGIDVEDEGSGIPLREQSRVFEPFVRGEGSVRDQRPGSGLGLHLVRRVAEMQGGRVRLRSPYHSAEGEERKGCRFTVMLPIEEAGSDG